MLCAKIALLVLVFDPDALNAFSQPKALVSHASAYVLLGLLTALALYHGRQMLRWSPVHVPVAAYVGAYVLATAFALDHRVALYGAPDRSLGFISVLDSVLVYTAVVALVRTRVDLLWLGATLAVTTVLLLGYAIVQRLGLDPIPWASGLTEARPQATMGNPGVLGQYAATVAVAAVALAIAVGRLKTRLVIACLAALALVTAWLAGARAATLGLTAGAAVVAAPHLLRGIRPGYRLPLAGGILFVALVVAAGLSLSLVVGSADVLRRSPSEITAALRSAGGSVTGRLDIYAAAFGAVRERPLLGVGPDNYVVAYPRYRPSGMGGVHESDAPQSSTHSWVGKILTDGGILAFGAFVATVFVGGVLAFRAMSAWALAAVASLAAFLGTGLFSIDHVATAWIPWLALGIIAAPVLPAAEASAAAQTHAQRRSGRRGRAVRQEPLTVIVGAIILASLLLALIAIRDPLIAAHHAQDARQAAGAGEGGTSRLILAAERAVALDSAHAEYWNLLGVGHLRADDLSQAARAFSEAARLAPYQYVYQTNLARAQLALGLRGDEEVKVAALATARRAAAMDPHVDEVQYMLTLAEIASANYQEGVDAGERWLELARAADAVIAEPMAGAYLALDRPADAERWVRLVVPNDAADRPKLRILLARALVAEGRSAEALQQVEFVLAVDPTNPAALRLKDQLTR